MQSQTLIAVDSVVRSSEWYQELLECESVHGGAEYDRLKMPDAKDFFLQLHSWHQHDHPNIYDPKAGPNGVGVLLWFLVDDFDAAMDRARQLQASFVVQPHWNPRASHQEAWITDPDGYTVVIASRPTET